MLQSFTVMEHQISRALFDATGIKLIIRMTDTLHDRIKDEFCEKQNLPETGTSQKKYYPTESVIDRIWAFQMLKGVGNGLASASLAVTC